MQLPQAEESKVTLAPPPKARALSWWDRVAEAFLALCPESNSQA